MSANFGFNKSLNLKGIYTEGEITQGSNREKVINQIIYILILYVTHVNIHSFFFVQFFLFSLLNEVWSKTTPTYKVIGTFSSGKRTVLRLSVIIFVIAFSDLEQKLSETQQKLEQEQVSAFWSFLIFNNPCGASKDD